MTKPKFKHLLILTSLLIASSAGFFSVTGISQLFVGAQKSTLVMAASLELAKLVAVSFTYRYWTRIAAGLKAYFLIACIVLMSITSFGIYGYLSSAYAGAASSLTLNEGKIAMIENQQKMLDGNIERADARMQTLIGVRTQQENRLDSLVGKNGQISQQSAIRRSDATINELQTQLSQWQRSRDSLDQEKLTLQTTVATDGKIGTFWYIAKTFNVPLDKIVVWFILAIVLVFDPLSVSLVLAYQIADKKDREEVNAAVPEPTEAPLLPTTPLVAMRVEPETVGAPEPIMDTLQEQPSEVETPVDDEWVSIPTPASPLPKEGVRVTNR